MLDQEEAQLAAHIDAIWQLAWLGFRLKAPRRVVWANLVVEEVEVLQILSNAVLVDDLPRGEEEDEAKDIKE